MNHPRELPVSAACAAGRARAAPLSTASVLRSGGRLTTGRGSSLAALVIALALLLAAAAPRAAIIAAWNFNGPLTGTLLPSTGAGRLDAVGTGVSIFASGEVGGGSSDTVVGNPPDQAWQVSAFPQQGSASSTAGIQGLVDTRGHRSIVVSFDFRATAASARHQQFQYTLDGRTFNDWGAPVATMAVDPWTIGRRFDLSGFDGAADNGLFGFRVVSVFAPGSAGYQPVLAGNTYATSGSWRFDMLTVSGMPLAASVNAAVVPVPPAGTLLACGLLVLLARGAFLPARQRRPLPAL